MRIITGSARGCRLKTPKGQETTRPTSDRVKESLFNILGQMVLDRTVLDVFAGTGNLGLEALSRGAASAVMVDRATAELIGDNARLTRLQDKVAVKAGDAVTKGQPLAVMEAMKMEHTIAAPADGVVQELLYAPGDQVTEGAELLKLSAA